MFDPQVDEFDEGTTVFNFHETEYGVMFGLGMSKIILGMILLVILLFSNKSKLLDPSNIRELSGYGKASALFMISILLGIVGVAMSGVIFCKSKSFNPDDHSDEDLKDLEVVNNESCMAICAAMFGLLSC